MRICLTNPLWKDNGNKGIRAGCRVPTSIGKEEHTFIPFPFALAYAAGVLEQNGFSVLVIDAIAEDLPEDEYIRRIRSFAPHLIVNEISTQSHTMDIAIADRLSTVTGARIALCGPHASAIADEILSHVFIDFVLIGEYEATLLDLAKSLAANTPPDQIEGLAYRTNGGVKRIGTRRSKLVNLDDLPYPYRDSLPMQKYSVAGYPPPVLFMYASRGCPYQCSFCVWPQWIKPGSYRVRTPRDVADEIDFAQSKYGPFNSIYFDDDTFNIGKKRMLEMADALSERSNKIPWGANMRPDLVDEESIAALVETGLFNMRIGVESGDPEILKKAHKNLNLDTVPKCIEIAHRFGVKVHVTFTIGLPGESWSSVKRTAAYARSLNADSMSFTITTPYPGTAYYDEVKSKNYLVTEKWSNFNNRSNAVMRTEHLSPQEITEAERYVMRAVYYSPRYILRRLKYINGWPEFFALARKSMTFLKGSY